jgi:hypothetical protein
VNLLLRGHQAVADAGNARAAPIELLFNAASEVALPPTLSNVRLCELPQGRFRLEATESTVEFCARGMQVHRSAAQEFAEALPKVRVPVATRAAWTLLLTVLKLPGATRMIARLRGSA